MKSDVNAWLARGSTAFCCALLISAQALSVSVAQAESQAAVATQETALDPSTTKDAPLDEADVNESDPSQQPSLQAAKAETSPVPQDTRAGVGLRDRKLSDVFEQFVPSETISADNAVPFPTDI